MFPEWQRWRGETVVCMASGPSMAADDADYCRGRARVITVNTTYRLAPWADVHYSSDHDWWGAHLREMRLTCSGEFWTGHRGHIADDMHHCPYNKRVRGISRVPGMIAWGGNSGYCALGLAHQFGVARIILLGYDQCDPDGTGHWHGQHDDSIRKDFNWPMWRKHFGLAARDFRRLGVDVINCSRVTALDCFRRSSLLEALC